MTPEEIASEYPHLILAQAHAALTYYYANREEIEADIVEEERQHGTGREDSRPPRRVNEPDSVLPRRG